MNREMFVNYIKKGRFDEAYYVMGDMNSKEIESILMRIGDEEQDLSVYTFVVSLYNQSCLNRLIICVKLCTLYTSTLEKNYLLQVYFCVSTSLAASIATTRCPAMLRRAGNFSRIRS